VFEDRTLHRSGVFALIEPGSRGMRGHFTRLRYNCMLSQYIYIPVALLFLLSSVSEGALCKYLTAFTARDTILDIWVVFRDKAGASGGTISKAALARRARAGAPSSGHEDTPVASAYISAVQSRGGTLRHIVKWVNAASFSVHARNLMSIAEIPSVAEVIPVTRYERGTPLPPAFSSLGKGLGSGPADYGDSYLPLAMLGVPWAQAEIKRRRQEVPGAGVVIASFDNGCRLDHPCFGYIREHNAIVADSDFVDHDGDPSTFPADHGSQTMALIAGYDPPRFMGVAWGGKFIIARTEDDLSETRVEEDNWAAAIVWAESLGVDIVTSSLGYRTDYTDSLENYTYADMNGRSTVVARAAQIAIDKGVIIVNSMGNESHHTSDGYQYGTIVSPADVADVISVGAVDLNGALAYWSGTGPTADGRRKPDLVAPGVSVSVPASQGYGPMSGTSFAAPLIAGVTALIKQSFPDLPAAEIRRLLYRTCAFTASQDSADNVFGRGAPDAMLAACLDSSESYLQVVDSLGAVVAGAQVFHGSNLVGVTDSFGVAIVRSGGDSLPREYLVGPSTAASLAEYRIEAEIGVRILIGRETALVVDSASIKKKVILATIPVWISLTDSAGKFINNGSVFVRVNGSSRSIVVYGSAPGYVPSAHDTIDITGGNDTLAIRLAQRPVSSLIIFPSVLSRRQVSAHTSPGMTIEFSADADDPLSHDQSCLISIRSIDGKAVWSFSSYMRQNSPLADPKGNPVIWNCRTVNEAVVAAGVYFVIVRYAGKTYTRKVLVNG
jgi:serine protease AprX